MNVTTPEIPATLPPERLLAEFPVPTPEQWRAAAVALLKGAPFEKKLITPRDAFLKAQDKSRFEPLLDKE